MRSQWLVAAALLWLASAGSALAVCQGTTVLFQDTFEKLQPTWGEPNRALKVDNGQLVISPATEQYFWAANSAGTLRRRRPLRDHDDRRRRR